MLTDRDLEILEWIDKYKAITVEQARYIFFKGSYEAARRRLAILEKDKIIKSYISRTTKQKVYYIDKKISDHDLYILDYIKELKKLNCEILDIKLKPLYLNGLMIPDAFVRFKFSKYTFNTLLEVDFTHATEELKLNTMYEKLAKECNHYPEFKNRSFILINTKPVVKIKYNSKNFDSIYTDLKYTNLGNFLGLEQLLSDGNK